MSVLSVLAPHIIPQGTQEEAVSVGHRAESVKLKDPGDLQGEISQEALS